MNIERGVSLMKQPSEQPKPEKVTNLKNPDLMGLASHDLEIVAQKRDNAKISEIRASLGLEQADATNDLPKYLQEYLGLTEVAFERIKLLKARELPKDYQVQLEALQDERLDDVTIAVIPDDLWVKGSQPSESSAENKLISIKQSYFEAPNNPDEIAWMIHELAHCQNFLDSKNAEDYEKNMQRFAFEDLKTEYPYPNNLVEQATFTKQFKFLKAQGKSREDVMGMLNQYYHEEDIPFFNRLLDGVYGK